MSKNSKIKRRKYITAWIITAVLSVLFLFFGSRIFSGEYKFFTGEAEMQIVKVTQLGDCIENAVEGTSYSSKIQLFSARIIKGERKGEYIAAYQQLDSFSSYQDSPVKEGDVITVYMDQYSLLSGNWTFGEYYRLDHIITLAVFFVILILIFGRIKGFNTLISLVFTVLAVFVIFIPSILNGHNIYLMTVIICIYTIVMTLIITSGPSMKSLTTIIGSCFGVSVAAILNIVMSNTMKLSGIIDEHSVYLQYLNSESSIDLLALIFAMVTIGSMGAVMDVAMDISSSLAEIHRRNPDLSFKEIYISGIRIGRDIMGTMANTLVLAYIGSSLCAVLLNITYTSSLVQLLNREGIIVELMQSLIGSMAILLTIPLTAISCGILYTNYHRVH